MVSTTSSCLHEQHDDHIWLTVNGEGWAIHKMDWPYLWLWRGYEPNIEHTFVEMSNFNAEAYCNKAVALLYG
jgi:hypothetical protein